MAEVPEYGAEVRLKIVGEHRAIDVQALHQALSALLDLFKASGLQSKMLITTLEEGSVELGVRPSTGDAQTVRQFDTIVAGLGELARELVPDSWNIAMLECAVSLSSALDFDGVQGLRISADGIGEATVTTSTRDTARHAATFGSVSIGSVTGRIHRFFDHKSRREFGLIDDLTQHSVKVTFTLGKEADVLRAVGQTVEAWGELRRNREGRKVQLKLDGLRVLERSDGPPNSDEIVGLLGSDWTGGRTSVDFVRRQRDGE